MRVQRSASRAAGFTVRWLGRLPASPRSRVYARRAVPPTQTIAPAVRGVLRSSRLRPFSDPHAFSCPERLISIDPIIRQSRPVSGHAVLRSVLGTLTGPRGLVVACVTDRRLLWSAVSAPAECSSLDANTRGLQLTTLAACHCRVRPAPLRPLTRVSAYSVSVGRFCGLCGWRPLLTDDSTGSHLLLSPPRAIWGAGTAQDRKRPP